jgi:hypothetical protein
MMKRNSKDHGFVSLRVEGGILPPEFLQAISSLKAPKQTGTDYGISKNLNIKDEIGRYWRIAEGLWEDYKDRLNRKDLNPTDVCVKYWLREFLVQVLGYRDVNATSSIPLGERVFPINYKAENGNVPLVLTTKDFELDKSHEKFGVDGHRRPPHELLQEYLNAEDACLWGIVSNGIKIRLLRNNPSLTRPAYIEADLEQMFEEELYSDFAVFWLTFHASRLTPKDSKPTNCILEAWRSKAQKIGERALDNLREGVTQALRELGNGFLQHPANETLRSSLQEGSLAPLEYFQELLRLVYRFLFLLTAEERNLLSHPEASDKSKHLYEDGYSISRLRDKSLKKRNYDNHSDLWQGLLVTFKSLSCGAKPLGLTALGGLFANDQCLNLDQGKIDNAHLLEAVRSLSFFRSGNTLARINYRDMNTEELGSVYESLLELQPKVDVDTSPWKFGFIGDEGEDNAQGSERKLTGSYYTPSSLVDELIKSTLVPVMRKTVKDHPEDPIGFLLKLKIIDPACGSGHFLLAAARRMANEIARLEALPDTPNEQQRQHALREVVQHCIYGVDHNPLSVELCKTALWIETVEPGKPLTFLDPHIRCGDSLVGIFDPKIMEDGIPNDAYKTLAGDDRSICTELKRRNRQSGAEVQGNLFEKESLKEISVSSADVDIMPEDTVEQIDAKRKAWEMAHKDNARRQEELRANLFMGSFFSPKTQENIDYVPITKDLNRINKGLEPRGGLEKVVSELVAKNRFFHWHIEFSEIFKNGGFDVVLGNPPWEVLQVREVEYFSSRIPSIACLPASERKLAILSLQSENPGAWKKFQDFLRSSDAQICCIKSTGRFNLVTSGKLNSYSLFAELFLNLFSLTGRAGFIVQSGIITDQPNRKYLNSILDANQLVSAYDMVNLEGIFPGVHRTHPHFCLMTLAGPSHEREASVSFHNTNTEHLRDKRRVFVLKVDDIKLVNPNTQTYPIFRSNVDAELTKKIYQKFPVLINETSLDDGNTWNAKIIQNIFSHSSDNSLFQSRAVLLSMNCVQEKNSFTSKTGGKWLPLYEAKMVGMYDHRLGSFAERGDVRGNRVLPSTSPQQYKDLNYEPQPFYWVSEKEVTQRIKQRNWDSLWLIGWKDITTSITKRTTKAMVIPLSASDDTISFVLPGKEFLYRSPLLLGNLNSLVLDYIARQKIGGLHLRRNTFIQLPIIPPMSYSDQDVEFLMPRIIELTYTSEALKPFASDMGFNNKPYSWNPERRILLQAELDAYYAYLYGLTQDELRYILDPSDVYGEDFPSETFRVLKNNEIKEFGYYRTQRLVIEAWSKFVKDGTFDLTRLNDPSAMPRIQAELAEREKDLEELLKKAKSTSLPKLFVEGETDKTIIESAWSIFKSDISMPFDICAAGGTKKMGSLTGKGAALKQVLGDQVVYILADNDMEGRKLLNDGHIKQGGRWEEQSNGTYWCLLEPTEEFKTFVEKYGIPEDYRPFTIEACFSANLRRKATGDKAYSFSGSIQSELLENKAVTEKIVGAYKEQDESHDDYFYFMAPAHEAKEKFAEWITQPDQCTPENYLAFEKIIKDLSNLITQ